MNANKKISYFKTQWFKLVIGIAYFVLACIHLFSPAIDTSTLYGLRAYTEDSIIIVFYFVTSMIWLLLSVFSYHSDRIEQLENRISALETNSENN